MDCINQHRAATVAALEPLDAVARVALTTKACRDHAGSLILPNPRNNWSSHLVELSLLGIHASGETAADAVTEWMRCAMRCHDYAASEGAAA